MILDGKKVSEELLNKYKTLLNNSTNKIEFAIIWVGNDEASNIYVNNKIKKCESVGIKATLYHLDSNTKEEELLTLIDKLNNDVSVKGILLQSPIPEHLDIHKCFNRISPSKDIDGFSTTSVGNLVLSNKGFIPCTPKGIMYLIDYYNINPKGMNVVIINRSNIVGKPLANLFLNKDATVTVCHSKTKNLDFFTKNADIIVTAVGKENFITRDMVKDGVIIIDVGIVRVNGKVKGDVDFENVKNKCKYITPVPGGVGPMTIAMVIGNIIEGVNNG